jgi:hypothetical protein
LAVGLGGDDSIMTAMIQLFRMLPAVLQIAWVLLFSGMVALGVGYLSHVAWQSYVGLGGLGAGYLMVFLDMRMRKHRRSDAAGFYTGATAAPLIALMMLVVLALFGAGTLAIFSMFHGFSATNAMRLLHLLGILFAFLVVTGIPRIALKAREMSGGRTPNG